MGNLSFWELRDVISKSCSCTNQSEDIDNRYAFSVDIEKLESFFREKQSSFYSMAFDKKLNSKIPSFGDIQLISEYMRNEDELDSVFNGKVQVCEFMVFSKNKIQGPVEINDGDGVVISDQDLFDYCNDPDKLDENIIYGIVKNLPMHKILITRKFNYEHDAFDYNIYIRSNYEMVTYYKAVQEKKEKKNKNKK